MFNIMQSSFQNGYKLKINKFEQCDSKAIYKLTGMVVELTKECSVFFKGCVELKKPIKTFKVRLNAGSIHYVIAQYNKWSRSC
jgi:hypothetical protein